MIRKCSKCDAPATHIPRLSMFAFSGASPAVMFFDLPLCMGHKVTAADMITDQAWTALVLAIVAQRKLAPRRDLNRVDLVRLTHKEAREFYRLVALGRAGKVDTPDKPTVH